MNPDQQSLPFFLGEAEDAERRAKLTLALGRMQADLAMREFVLWVFRCTDGGREGRLLASYQRIAEKLCCSPRTAQRKVSDAIAAGIITLHARARDGRAEENGYAIHWLGVATALGQSPPAVQCQPPGWARQNDQPLSQFVQAVSQNVYAENPDENRPRHAIRGGPEASAEAAPSLVPMNQEDSLPMYQGLTNGIDIGSSAAQERAAATFAAVAAAVVAAAEPAEQKARLRRRIEAVVRDPKMGAHVSAAAADLVVLHGVEPAELDRILADVEAMRAAGSLRSAGALFHSKIRKLAERRGAPWPGRRRAATEPRTDTDEHR